MHVNSQLIRVTWNFQTTQRTNVAGDTTINILIERRQKHPDRLSARSKMLLHGKVFGICNLISTSSIKYSTKLD